MSLAPISIFDEEDFIGGRAVQREDGHDGMAKGGAKQGRKADWRPNPPCHDGVRTLFYGKSNTSGDYVF